MDKIKLAQRKLAKALRTLAPEAGRVARRNARARVFAAIKSLEHAIDADFPLEPKKAKRVDTALKACSERMTAVGFARELQKIAPETWDPLEVQLFANWWLNKCGREVRPVVLDETNRHVNRRAVGDEILIAKSEDVGLRYVRLWDYLAWNTVRAIFPAQKYTERALVRAMFKIASAWNAQEWREYLAPEGESGEPYMPKLACQ